MKGFKLSDTGDVVFSDGAIELVSDTELERQTLQTLIGTNKGEDIFNSDEGIDFYQILGKSVTEDKVKTQVRSGITQLNTDFGCDYVLEDFAYSVEQRKSFTDFTARKSSGEAVALSMQNE